MRMYQLGTSSSYHLHLMFHCLPSARHPFSAAKVAASLPSCKHRSYSITKMTAAFPLSFSLLFQNKAGIP